MYALNLRITLHRRHKIIPLNITLNKEDWNAETQKVKPSHANAKLINIKISQALTEIQEKALKFETIEKVYDVTDLTPASSEGSTITFQSFTIGEIESLRKAGRIGNAITYRTALNKLIAYTGKEGIRFEQIDYRLLEHFTSAMLSSGMKLNAVASYMREIRAIYNKAIKAGVVEQKYYPFNKYKIRTTKTISRALTLEEMKSIANLELEPNTPIWNARNYFMLSFCLIGINFTDMFKLTPESIAGDRIIYHRSKTHKIYSVYLHPEAKAIINLYYQPLQGCDFLFSILTKADTPTTAKKKLLQAIKTTNKYLGRIAAQCNIEKEITTYYARYAWANISRKLGYSKEIISQALGHEYGNKVTGIYLDDYSDEVIDMANKSVIDALRK
jgi:site-specific recombinase XerD